MNIDITKIVRPNINYLKGYSSARDEFTGKADVFLDANENSLGSPVLSDHSRYPDPLQVDVRTQIAKDNGLNTENVFLGNGSDEAIDLMLRIFCRPGQDNVIICPPTYGMYAVCADINDISLIKVPLLQETFDVDTENVLSAINRNTKIIFLCSPNNPTGNNLSRTSIIEIVERFQGIVVVDEAYIHFSEQASLIDLINEHNNLVVTQTFSKAWGLAGLRLGTAFADKKIISLMNKVKYPYNVSDINQTLLLSAIDKQETMKSRTTELIELKTELQQDLSKLKSVVRIYPSDANFLLTKVTNAAELYEHLMNEGIIVRNRSKELHCDNCLRITVGTKEENRRLVKSIQRYEESTIY